MGYILRLSLRLHLTPPPPPKKKPKTIDPGDVACSLVVGHLPSVHETLDSNPSNKHTRLMTILFVSDLGLSGLPRLALSP